MKIKMGKCRACSKGICEEEYRNRYKCEDRENFTCTCQESTDVLMTGRDYITDVAVGTVVGVVTGGLGSEVSAATQGGYSCTVQAT